MIPRLTRHEMALVAGGALLVGAAVLVGSLGGAALGTASGFAVLTCLALGGQLALHRRSELGRAADARQLEAVASLVAALRVRAPLPALRGWAISPDLAGMLVSLVRRRRPRLVLEMGSGASTVILAYALEANGSGRLVSLDHDAFFARSAREMLEDHGLTAVARVVEVPLRAIKIGGKDWTWYDLATAGDLDGIDMLVVDGPPNSTGELARYPALPLLKERLSRDAVIVLDDGVHPDVQHLVERWMDEDPGLAREDLETEKGTIVLTRTGN